MFQILSTLLLALFLAWPPLLLGLRLWKGKPNWWLIVLSIPVISWLCVNGLVWVTWSDLARQIGELEAAGKPVPEKLIEDAANDGAPKVFGLFFGWAYQLPFFLGWLLPYAIILGIRKARVRNASSSLPPTS